MDERLFAYAIEHNQVPRLLYKYRTIKQTIQILENPALFFPGYHKLNDPFECYANVTPYASAEQWYKYLLGQGVNPVNALPMAAEIVSQPQRQAEIVLRSIEHEKMRLGILCLSSSPLIPPMWAHYSENHKGACIEFDISKDLASFLFPKEVEYSDDVKRFNYIATQIQNSGTAVVDPLFHKTTEWSYEKEFRIVKMKEANRLIKINPESISAVTFGKDCPADKITQVKDLILSKNYNWIKTNQIVVSPSNPKMQLKAV